MQPSAASIICFSWREIAATGGNSCNPYKGGNYSSAKSNDGVKLIQGNLGFPSNQNKNTSGGRQGYNIFRLGGELSGFKRLVQGPIPDSMRFSYR